MNKTFFLSLDCGDVYLSSVPSNEIKLGSKFTLKCFSSSNPPVTSYKWFKDSNMVSTTRKNILELKMSSLSDGGLYKCEVECLTKKKGSILNVNPICTLKIYIS